MEKTLRYANLIQQLIETYTGIALPRGKPATSRQNMVACMCLLIAHEGDIGASEPVAYQCFSFNLRHNIFVQNCGSPMNKPSIIKTYRSEWAVCDWTNLPLRMAALVTCAALQKNYRCTYEGMLGQRRLKIQGYFTPHCSRLVVRNGESPSRWKYSLKISRRRNK